MGTRFEVRLAPADLARVRFALSPMQHLLIGLQGDTPTTQRWLRRVARRIPAHAMGFVELATAHPSLYIPDFLSPAIPRSGPNGRSAIDDELDVIRAVSAAQLDEELGMYEVMHTPPRLVLELREGGTAARDRLTRAIRAIYEACLAEDWPDISRRLDADVGYRIARMGEEGSAAMLAGVHPILRGIGGIGGAPGNLRVDFEVHAQGTVSPNESYVSPGRGLLIAPNLFLDGALSPSLSPWQEPQFLYPPGHAPAAPPRDDGDGGGSSGGRGSGGGRDALTVLLGRARAGVLRAIRTGCTTAELAARLRVSPPTASVQAAALREAGLIATARDGRRVRHTLTPLGLALLEANPHPGN
jgi:DNA-binding transcriptional ArsR family regulator